MQIEKNGQVYPNLNLKFIELKLESLNQGVDGTEMQLPSVKSGVFLGMKVMEEQFHLRSAKASWQVTLVRCAAFQMVSIMCGCLMQTRACSLVSSFWRKADQQDDSAVDRQLRLPVQFKVWLFHLFKPLPAQ